MADHQTFRCKSGLHILPHRLCLRPLCSVHFHSRHSFVDWRIANIVCPHYSMYQILFPQPQVLRGQPLMQVVFHEPDGTSHSGYSDICSVIGWISIEAFVRYISVEVCIFCGNPSPNNHFLSPSQSTHDRGALKLESPRGATFGP